MYSYITVLSNWIQGYEKYSKIYSKKNLNRSTFPNIFYLLKEEELEIGLLKAKKLIDKINEEHNLIYSDNKIIKINTLPKTDVFKNIKNNKGWFINQDYIEVHSVEMYLNEKWIAIDIEDLNALSYKLSFLKKYEDLTPRSLSFLPIASACEAKCKFCFSESSISVEQTKKVKDFEQLDYWCEKAKNKGSERFVITGGGEPGIMKFDEILKILSISSKYFKKNTMISNGVFLSKRNEEEISDRLKKLKSSGLDILSLSYHHYDFLKNKEIMGIDTNIKKIFEVKNKIDKNKIPNIRLVCVLQKTGIHDQLSVDNYIKFALRNKISQICFKELYVASTHESLYFKSKENVYSQKNQVSLDVIKKIIENNYKYEKISELPWGSPIFRVYIEEEYVDIALYTEPSLGWERNKGIARSWNYMADKKCYASLEDSNSVLNFGE